MIIGKICEYNGQYAVLTKKGFFGEWTYCDCFDEKKQAEYLLEDKKCIFVIRKKIKK